MIDRDHKLPLARQAKAVGISRGSIYYRPRPVGEAGLGLMRRIDELHLEYPFAGSRMMRGLLCQEGLSSGRRHIATLMRRMGIEALYLKAYQNGTETRKGIGAYLAFYNQERPHQALGYRSPGQVFQAVSPQRCLLEHPRALPSEEGLRDTPAVDSLILASPLS